MMLIFSAYMAGFGGTAFGMPVMNAAQCTPGNNPQGSTAACAVGGQFPCEWNPAGAPTGSVLCDLGPICPTVGEGAKAILVENEDTPNVSSDFVLSGHCGTQAAVQFCCILNDPGGEIDFLALGGTELPDDLSFW